MPANESGPYKLLQQIGEGGFGTVWMAEQVETITRRMALKIIKLGMDTREVIARFEAGRQALAMMEHPNIAKVLGAGATDKGRPFFVRELVKGMPVTQYCDERQPGTRERLLLFGDVRFAIIHAHRKGVIHRDIKPSNVLVTRARGTGAVHLRSQLRGDLDWIVMKALEKDRTRRYETASGNNRCRLRQLLGIPATANSPVRQNQSLGRRHGSGTALPYRASRLGPVGGLFPRRTADCHGQ